MRILQVHTLYREEGGEDTVARVEAEVLRRAGHELVSYTAHNPQAVVPAAASLLVSAWNPLAARSVRAVAERLRPDVAHVHNTWFALSPSVIAALDGAGVPVVMTLHNYRLLCVNASLFRDGRPCEDCVGTHPWHGVRHRCYRGSVGGSAAVAGVISVNRALGTWQRHVRLFLALNEFARERFIRGGLPPGKVRVKPNFVPDPGPRVTPPSRSRSVLFVGRLEPKKGIGLLLDAWRLHQPAGLRLVIIGDGPLRSDLESRAPRGVRFEGRLAPEAVRRWMLQARALVFPSLLYEGQPMSILESFAAGLPVLASRLGGNAELLLPAGQEWLVGPGGPDTWAHAFRLLQDPGRIDQASGVLRQLYEWRFNEQAGRRHLEAAYLAAQAPQV
jgi:glycosyltransferase involved in cell wall biosynthesis